MDFAGRPKAGPFESNATLEVTANGRFLYSVYDAGSEYNRPVLFNASGQQVARLTSRTGSWDLRPLSDSTFLYRDGGKITIYRLRRMNPVASYSTGVEVAADLPRTALSGDCSVYAFLTRDEVIIVNLADSAVSHCARPECDRGSSYPYLLFSSSGDALVVLSRSNSSERADLIVKGDSGYEKRSSPYGVTWGDGWVFAPEQSFVKDGLVVLNHREQADSTFHYRSSVFNLYGNPASGFLGIEGLVVPALSPGKFKQVQMSARTADIIDLFMRPVSP